MIWLLNPSVRLLIAISPISACSMPQNPPEEPAQIVSEHFSSEDRRVARLLSPGSDKINSADSPYEKALLCQLSVEAVGQELKRRGIIVDEQEKALEQIEKVYAQRIAASARSEQELSQDRTALRKSFPDPSDLARLGISCMREFT